MQEIPSTIDVCTVSVPKRDICIPPGQSIQLSCKADAGYYEERTPLLFEPDEKQQWPEGLILEDFLVTVPVGVTSHVTINLANSTRHDLTVQNRTCLGRLIPVVPITPLPVRYVSDGKIATITTDKTPTKIGRKILKGVPSVDLSHLTTVESILYEEREAFAESDEEIGNITDPMRITLTDKNPTQKRYNSVPKPLCPEIKAYIEDLLNQVWITESASNYSSPIVAVRKKNGELRLCCDYRGLNSKTVPDRHPLPRIQESQDMLGGNSWFSLLDQGKAYHQSSLDQKSRRYTAFITPWGLYEWMRVPLGLTNAPAYFKRFMERCLRGLRDECAIPYLDDVIVFSKSLDDHLKHLKAELRRLCENGVKLKPSKCNIFRREVNYLGRIVSETGCRPDPKAIQSVMSLKEKTPETLGNIRQMVGLLNCFRRYIQDFAKIASPPFNLLHSPEDIKWRGDAKDVKVLEKTTGQLSSKTKIKWEDIHQITLEKLLDQLEQPPILAYPDYEKPFILHTDASLR